MIISALHLIAYGHFSGRSLRFGASPGFHLIYGDNEAGKSTTLRALSSALYGYPHEVVDGYLHDSKDIALGAELVAKDGQALSFVRKRRGKNALATSDGVALDEGVLAKMLGGAPREAFERVFALDHRRLQDDAKALLSEGGSIGFALATAGAGLSGLKAALDQLRADRAALFLPGGSKPTINQRIATLNDLRKEARRRSVSLGDYKKRQKDIDAIESALAEARAKSKAAEVNGNRLARVQRNLPLRVRLIATVEQLKHLEAVPLLPVNATARRVKAEADRESARRDVALAHEALKALEKELDALAIDHAVLARGSEIDSLAAQRAILADEDIPKKKAERAARYGTVRDLLANAELSGAAEEFEKLLPPLVKRKQVVGLADKGRALKAQEETLVEAAAAAGEAVRLAEERLSLLEIPADIDNLNAVLLSADSLGDIHADIKKRLRLLDTKTRIASERVVGLGLKQGDLSELRRVSVPSDETVLRFRLAFSSSDADVAAAVAELKRLADDRVEKVSRIERLTLSGEVATKEGLLQARAHRDAVWLTVRAALLQEQTEGAPPGEIQTKRNSISDEFTRRVGLADATADAIIEHTKEAAELSLLTRETSAIESKIVEAQSELRGMEVDRDELEARWALCWPQALVIVRTPAEMTSWLNERTLLLQDDVEQRNEANAIAELNSQAEFARASLLGVLAPLASVDQSRGLSELREQARALVKSAAKVTMQHAKAIEALESARDRKQQADSAKNRMASQIAVWSTNWQKALQENGLDQKLSIDSALAVLEIMASLDGLKLQIDDLTHRIHAMAADKAAFESAIATLRTVLADGNKLSALEAGRELKRRLDAAVSADGAARSLRDQRKIREAAQREANERLDASEAILTALCIAAGCQEPNELAAIEQLSTARQTAQRDHDQLVSRMVEDGAGLSLDELLSECEDVVGDELPGQIATLADESRELNAAIESLVNDRAKLRAAFDSMFGADQAGETLQDIASVEAELSDLVQRYTDLALQEIALREAIELYRGRNQGPILGRAKALFMQLTDGAYAGLRADVDDRDEAILVAEHSTRGSLEVIALSDGTADPLYLALRLAVVQEHNATREPLPFVADDLFLNLDNNRARAALKALGSIAESGQVLFFTHHEHMLEMARNVLPKSVLVEHRL